MRFLFIDCFDLKWNGYTARFENGISGSHNAFLYLAEGLAKIDHRVIITSTNNNIIEGSYLKVDYINSCNLNETEYDYIITHNILNGLCIVDKLSFQKLIILSHDHLFNHNDLFSISKEKVIIAYISEFAKENILNVQPFLKDYQSILLHNCIDIQNLPPIQDKKKQLCFFACLDRGFKLVTEIMKQLDHTLVTNTYSPCYRNLLQSNEKIIVSDNTSKHCIYKHISESKYFIYPLINLDNNMIHYDTFAYCVLESLLLGVVVIAPRIAVFEELYGDAICYIDSDDIPKEDLLYWQKTNSNFGYPLIDKYVSIIHTLDNNEALRNSYIQKGIALKEKFHYEKITTHFLNVLGTIEKESKNILTVFAGRRPNLEILTKYLKKALEQNIIQEVHFWNNARNREDEEYIKSISNVKRTSSTGSGNYIRITPEIIEQSFELYVQATNDIHVKLVDVDEYEIVLGGWNNTHSVIRKNNIDIYNKSGAMGSGHYKFVIQNGIQIYKNGSLVLYHSTNITLKDIYVKTGHNCVGEFHYKTTQNHGFYFMDTCEKSWKNYYQHYTNKPYDVILKCDDDIVFMDLNKLPSFIQCVKENDYLVFANTINNCVSAHIQQEKYNLIPKELMQLEYPKDGKCGSLWESGKKAETLHYYFLDHIDTFLNCNENETIPIETRFSINFFGINCSRWHKIKDAYEDDELSLTVDYVKDRSFKNVFYSDFYVSHLSFYRQVETGIDLDSLRIKYNAL